MERVVLEMDVHCEGCARKIRKAVVNVLGVEKVLATPETGLVVVTGTADAEVLRSRIERRMRRDVVILSDGAAAREPARAHWAMPPHGRRDGGWAAPRHDPRDGGWAMPPRRYEAPRQAYPYHAGNRYWAAPPRPRRHVSHGVPARRDEDEEGPQECCTIQ